MISYLEALRRKDLDKFVLERSRRSAMSIARSDQFKVQEVVLFGSYSRGEQKKQSDVDVLVKVDWLSGDMTYREFALAHLQTLAGEMPGPGRIEVTVFSTDDLDAKYNREFRTSVETDGIILYP